MFLYPCADTFLFWVCSSSIASEVSALVRNYRYHIRALLRSSSFKLTFRTSVAIVFQPLASTGHSACEFEICMFRYFQESSVCLSSLILHAICLYSQLYCLCAPIFLRGGCPDASTPPKVRVVMSSRRRRCSMLQLARISAPSMLRRVHENVASDARWSSRR